MKGNFTFQEMPMEAPHVNEDVIICRNCAIENPGNGIKCIQCNFPITGKTKAENTISKIPFKAKLRIS
jgi:ribosomal protein L40E